MKKITRILCLTAGLVLTACTTTAPRSLTLEQIKAQPFSEISFQTMPDLSKLTRDISEVLGHQELVVGYQDRAGLEKLALHLGASIEGDIPVLKAALLKLPATLSLRKTAFFLSKSQNGGIRYAQANGFDAKLIEVPRMERSRSTRAADPATNKQWWLSQVRADKVRDIATGKGVTVGIVDDDFSRLHEDLKADGKIVTGFDAFSRELLTPDMPLTTGEHGSGSAGTVAQRRNGIQGEGIAPDAILMPIRVSRPTGFASSFRIANAMIWAVDHGAQILNNSWGGGGYETALKEAVDYALSKNVTVIASAGNDHRDLHNGIEAYTGVISVGASAGDDVKADFSNYGKRVDLWAPGDAGFTTYIAPGKPLDSYGLFGGTSMAGPVVAGGAALLIEKAVSLGKTLTPYQIKKMLVATGDPMTQSDPRVAGDKRLNVEKALEFTASTIPADGGNVLVQVTDLIENAPVPSSDVILSPLEGQNKGLDYLGQTAFGDFDVAGDPQNQRGKASFYGLEPGMYQVKVAGSSYYVYGGSRTALLGKVKVESGQTKTLQFQHQLDRYEYIDTGIRNGSVDTANSLKAAPIAAFAEGILLGGTFDNEYTAPAFPGAAPGTPDNDYFVIDLPATKTITVSTLGNKFGSLATAVVGFTDTTGAVLGKVSTPSASSNFDRVATYTNETGATQTLIIRLGEANNQSGLDFWYGQLIEIP
jgi:serine protease